MIGLLLAIATALDPNDRRLDPFQFNYCVWNLFGFDGRNSSNTTEMDNIVDTIYSSLSTCDIISLPGVYEKATYDYVMNKLTEKKMQGLQRYCPEDNTNVTVYSRLTISNITKFTSQVAYPIPNSTCNYTGESGIFDFSGSFYGNVKFHDPVNDTIVATVLFPRGTTPDKCAQREALATEICRVVRESSADHDFFVSGAFGADFNDNIDYNVVLEGCGFKAGSKIMKKKPISIGKKHLNENFYVFGGAQKWMDVFVTFEQKEQIYYGQDNISYPVSLYVHQPLSKRWKKFEIIYSTVILIAAASFFTWLLFYSRVKESDGYDKIPEGK